jgi:hypothetical protein
LVMNRYNVEPNSWALMLLHGNEPKFVLAALMTN